MKHKMLEIEKIDISKYKMYKNAQCITKEEFEKQMQAQRQKAPQPMPVPENWDLQ